MFNLTFNNESQQKIRRLAAIAISGVPSSLFWHELAALLDRIATNPTALGEVKYSHKFVNLRSYLVVGKFIAIQFAVSEERQVVFVEKLSLSGNHPYPPEFEEVLNPRKP